MKIYTRGVSPIIHDTDVNFTATNICTANGASVDVVQQDSSSKVIDFYFKRLLSTVTLSENAVEDAYSVTLTAGHGVQAGEYLSFLEDGFATQVKVLNVNTNIITIDSPMDYEYSTNSLVRRTSINMAVDGSSTPVVFNIVPYEANKWHINTINLCIQDNVEMDTAKFGGMTALSKGIVIRRKDGISHNICNVKTNGEFQVRGFETQYQTKAPSGTYGLHLTKRFNGQSGNGSVILLDGETNDELQIIIQDDLTALSMFVATVQGHYVID